MDGYLTFPFSSLLFSSLFHFFFFFSIFSFSLLFSTLPSLQLSSLISSTLPSLLPPLISSRLLSSPLFSQLIFVFLQGTWAGRQDESWNASTSTFLQVSRSPNTEPVAFDNSVYLLSSPFCFCDSLILHSFFFLFSFFLLFSLPSQHFFTLRDNVYHFYVRFLNICNRFGQSKSGFLERFGIHVVAHFLMFLLICCL